MGLFDLFDEANEQFCKDVRKAWDELWDNDTSADNDDRDDENIIGITAIVGFIAFINHIMVKRIHVYITVELACWGTNRRTRVKAFQNIIPDLI